MSTLDGTGVNFTYFRLTLNFYSVTVTVMSQYYIVNTGGNYFSVNDVRRSFESLKMLSDNTEIISYVPDNPPDGRRLARLSKYLCYMGPKLKNQVRISPCVS